MKWREKKQRKRVKIRASTKLGQRLIEQQQQQQQQHSFGYSMPGRGGGQTALHKHNNKSVPSFSSLPLSLLQSLEPALLIVVTTLHYTALHKQTPHNHLHSCRTCRTWCPHPRPSDSRCSHCRCAGRRCTESGRTRRQWDRRSGRRRSPSRDSLKKGLGKGNKKKKEKRKRKRKC